MRWQRSRTEEEHEEMEAAGNRKRTGDITSMTGTPGTLISGCVCNTVLFAQHDPPGLL